jgi:hypothetical protein
MKKYIYFTLLLVTFVLSINFNADADNISREYMENGSKQTAGKSRPVVISPDLGATERINDGKASGSSAVRDNAAGKRQAPNREELSNPSGIPRSIAFPQGMDDGLAQVNIKAKRRIAEIKEDGIINADEVSDYEAIKNIWEYTGNSQIPVIMNQVSEVEPNNTCDSAQAIACGDTVTCASLEFGVDDKDYFTFTVTESTDVVIETYPVATDECGPGTSAHGDTYLYLLNSTCTDTLAENDDIGGSPYSYFSKISLTLDAGTYVILSDNYWEDSGHYHLGLGCTPYVPPVACPEDSITIEIMTDDYGDETTWKVFVAGTGNAIDSGGP